MATAPIFDVDALLAAIRAVVKDAVAEALVEHGIKRYWRRVRYTKSALDTWLEQRAAKKGGRA